MTKIFQARLHSKLIEIKSNFRRKKLYRTNQGFNFLVALIAKNTTIVCTPPPSFCRGRGGRVQVEPPTKFSKRGGGLERTSTFREGLLGKRG